MAKYAPLIGFQPIPGTLQAPLASISKAVETIAEEFALDPSLPTLGEIMTDGRITYVVIPKARACGIKQRFASQSSSPTGMAGEMPTLTIAGPQMTDPDPLGTAQFDFYKEFPNIPRGMLSVFEKRQYIRFPYVNLTPYQIQPVYNSNLNGMIAEGMAVAPDYLGRPVQYCPEQFVTTGAIAPGTLAAALTVTAISGGIPYLPVNSVAVTDITAGTVVVPFTTSGITPTFIGTTTSPSGYTAPNTPSGAAQSASIQSGWGTIANGTISWGTSYTNGTADYIVTIPQSEETINHIYIITVGYGHKPQKKYGTVCRLATGIDENTLAGYIRNSVNNDYPYAPIMNPVFTAPAWEIILGSTTTHNGSVPSGMSYNIQTVPITANSLTVSLNHKYIDPYKPIVIQWCENYSAAAERNYVAIANGLLPAIADAGAAMSNNWITLTNASSPILYVQSELGAEFALSTIQGELDIDLATTRFPADNPALRVSYSYKLAQNRAQYEMGAYGNSGTGITGLTDGSVPGTFPVMTPAAALHPDGAGFLNMTQSNMYSSGIMNIMID